jgi:predicted N-acyltransferase
LKKENWRKFFGWKIEEIFNFLEKKYNKKHLPTKLMAKQKNEIFLKLISKKVKKIPGAVKFIKDTKIYFNKTAVATS